MQPIHTFNVVPKLPQALEPLREIVFNLWWTWQPDARKLFRHLDPELWHKTNHNPLRMLQLCRQARLVEVSKDDDFLREMHAVHAKFRAYLMRPDTYGKLRRAFTEMKQPVAYFSAEFGFHESIPNYSGGLGILSGDHCKSASDLDINFIAFTLLYRHGYFRQQINKEGLQESIQLNQNFSHLPVQDALDSTGKSLYIHVDMLGRAVRAKVWKMAVGRISLFMLDTDLPDNSEEDRLITAQLYGGDTEMRIKQEIVLGIGGVHALHAMGITPSVYHMNEGHSAFLSLELIRRQVTEHKLDFYSALQVVASGNIFTTHTPVPAGNDAFPVELMKKYFGEYPTKLGIDFETFASFGQSRKDPHEPFSMTILALRTSRHANGVSALHGKVSQGLWKEVWVGVPQEEVPITSITNGIHTKTWMAPEFSALYDQYLPNWEEHLMEPDFWRAVYDIPDEVLWDTHQLLKKRLVDFARNRIRHQRERLGESPEKIRATNRLLNPEVLTIGFARRFATYKRAGLVFSDVERLLALPVQIIVAGKAHPADAAGKDVMQEIVALARDRRAQGRIVFLENYDMGVARALVRGCDVWLNTPRRPLEASGTSGMKAAINGVLNLSVLDGWWAEGYSPDLGWAIDGVSDDADRAQLYRLLEEDVVPTYTDNRERWIGMMKESIAQLAPRFSMQRAVIDYVDRYYLSALQPARR